MKKGIMILMAFALFFVVSVGSADARPRGGGFKSPKKSYTTTPSKPADNVNKSTSGTSGTTKSGTATNANRGFFSGGGFMKGLMIGGLAGLMFGGLFGNMGFLGNIFGFLINILAIYVGIVLILGIVRYFRNRNKPANPDHRRPY
ncbi:hypothetical protein [Paenibacillus sacheonensis]|uniref:Preprotein translocase subunit Tim44 n=1 Tax=Paenibacillus sacheonensis TaxID=742054 RepID=A0A7X4YKG6_9BACL|nr:hypothetical protein [Paenibacillus sacheonensis]MBM7563400.1 putative lipid-binding transport protein (Tim44 family) [Paenibacillus sacheonensis]NBC68045.1 hypothetical protein [Paenibacillus sacheonensis]